MTKKGVKHLNNIWCADFETTSFKQYELEGETRVYLWYIHNVGCNISQYGCDMSSFFNYLETNLTSKKSTIYFHNLSFDGEFILWYLLQNKYIYKQKLEDKSYNTIIDEMGSIYSINVQLANSKIIEIRCSYKLFPASIKDIGKLVGIEKLDETHDYEEIKDFSNGIPKEELDYIRNDVKIMVALIKYLREKNIKGMTMSSSAFKNWQIEKYMLYKQDMNKNDNDEIVDIVRKSYRGGITKVNKKYANVEIDDAISFDVNSLYPSVMYENSMPIGDGKIYKSIEEALNNKMKKLIVVAFVRYATIRKGKHAFIGNTSGFSCTRSYSYDDIVENKYVYLWYDEFKLFEKIYDAEIEILKVVGFKEAHNVFKDYIDRWYKIKENPANEVERQLAKLMLNSLYGKFGMNSLRISKIPIETENEKIVYDINESETTYYYVEIASYITSMARVKYATFMNMCDDNFIYGDTDSIYYKGHEIPKMLEDYIDDKKIGYWKYEGHYTKFKALKAKCYLKQLDNGKIKVKIAGCPKECNKYINFDNFKVGLQLKGLKKQKMKVKGGIVIKNTDFTIKGV